jgi:TonB-dependent receptor
MLAPTVREAPFNRSFAVAFGGLGRLFGRKIGYAASVSYDRNFGGYRDGVLGRYERQSVNAPALAPLVRLADSRSEDDTLIGSLFNVAYQVSPEHQLSVNTMWNQAGNDMARRQKGLNVAGGGLSETETFETRTLRYTERDLRSLQLAGKHLFPALRDARLQWSVTDATTSQDEPDTRFFSTFQTPDGSQYFEASGLPRPSRYFRNLEESRDDYSVDLTLPFGAWGGRSAQFKAGWARAETTREYRERLFEYNSTVLRYDGDEQAFLRPAQVGQIDPATGRFRPGQLYLVETGSAGNSYLGEQTVQAGYAMLDLPVTRALRLVGGLRRETTDLEVRSRDPRRRAGRLDNTDDLPSASLVYALTDRMNLRAAVTKTIARPNFREIADYTSFEFVGDFVYIGNPNLRRTTIRNYDLRWEWFPRRGEIVALSFFHKRMVDPIERGVFSVINSGELQYQNAPVGEVRGIEIEARKNLGFLSEHLRGWSGGCNYTWVESSVEITPAELAFIRFFEPGAGATRELTGQSPYLLNFDLTYQHRRWGTTVSAYYNVFGARLAQVSPPGTPNVYEQPAPTLDLILNQTWRDRWKFTASVKNLLNEAAEETYTYRGVDYLRSSRRRGVTTALGVTYTY